jgi:DNA invertase Pin-like site-specific DNA recombinase
LRRIAPIFEFPEVFFKGFSQIQRLDLQRAAKARGLAISATYAARASAAKQRPAFDRMMTDARRGAFDVLVV